MAHLFFSYAHDDADWLYPIHARMQLLTEHNLWLDKIGLERGTAWEDSIKAAIDDSYGVIFAVTETFVTRPFILNKEIPWAFDRFKDRQGVQLFPILFDDVELPDLLKTPYITHLLDARGGDLERVYTELKHVLPLPQAGHQPFVVDWPRLTNFQGRDQLLVDLHAKLIGEGRIGVMTAGLHGMGGIGKTQLAVEYAYRYRFHYPAGVYWLNAASDWRKEIADCAVHVDRNLVGRPMENIVLAFRDHLAAQKSDALLILDNVTDPELVLRYEIAPKLTLIDLCRQSRTRLLLTTRVQTAPSGFEKVQMDVLTSSDARTVLLDGWTIGSRPDSADTTALDGLAEALGYLPLALGWMAAALRELPDLAPSTLFDELKTRGLDDLIRELQEHKIDLGTPHHHDRLIALSLDWQMDQLSGAAPRQVLALMAAYGEAAIVPLDRLRLLTAWPEQSLVKLFPQAIKALQNYNLVETIAEESALRLHPLTQHYMTQKLDTVAELSRAVPNLVNAYRDPETLDSHTRLLGFSTVISELRSTQQALNEADQDLDALARLFGLEESQLLTLSKSVHANYVIQQIRNRAYNEGENTLQSACDTWLANGVHFRQIGQRFSTPQTLLQILSGHTGNVLGAMQLTDDRILTWSRDKTLRLWEADGTPGPVFEGHQGDIDGAIQLSDGRLLSWAENSRFHYNNHLKNIAQIKHTRHRSVNNFFVNLMAGLIAYCRRLVKPYIQLNPTEYQSLAAAALSITEVSDYVLRLWEADGTPGPVLEGHEGRIKGALQLADSRILSWSVDKTLRLWEADGTPGPVLEGHRSSIIGVLPLFDGSLLSWAEKDKTLRLWESDGTPGPVLEGHAESVRGALQLADSRILTWSEDKTLRLWEADGTRGPVLEGHARIINGALQLADGRILTWSWDKSLRLWEADGTPGPVLEGHAEGVKGALQLADSRILSWAWDDRTMRLWETDGTPGPVLEGHAGYIDRAIQLSDGRLLSWATGLSNSLILDPILQLWEADGTRGPVLEGHARTINGALQLADGHLLSWGIEETLLMWNVNLTSDSVVNGHASRVEEVLRLNDNRILSWGVWDTTLRLWEADGTPGPILEGHLCSVRGALQLDDSRLLSWEGEDMFCFLATLQLWEADGTPGPVLEGHTSSVRGALQLADGRILSWAKHGRSLLVWEADGTPGPVLEGHEGRIKGALQLADSRILSWSEDLRLWEADGTPGPVLEGHRWEVTGVLQLADGRILSWGWRERTLRLWETDGTPGPVLEGHEDFIGSAIQLSDGRLLSWAESSHFHSDYVLRLWEADGTPGAVLEGHINSVKGALQLADGRILSWSEDKTLRLWESDGTPGPVLEGHAESVRGALQLADSRILTWSWDKSLRLWEASGESVAVYEGQTELTCCTVLPHRSIIVVGDARGRVIFLILVG